MFKLAPQLILLTKQEAINYTKLELVRYRVRKPIQLGTAKSKLFRIPKRPVESEEQRLELLRLHNNYRTKMKSLRYYFIINHSAEFTEVSEDPEESRRLFEEDFQRCQALNEKWNQEQKEIREKGVEKKHEEEITHALERIVLEKKKIEQRKQEIEEIVKKEKAKSETFITIDKLDAAIEHALANPVDYNFALNLNGERIVGRDNIPGRDKVQASQ